MTNYEKLVETLRWTANEYKGSIMDEDDKDTMNAAADAIEALQAENPIVESVLLDKMRQQMEETVCHCNVKENAELIAKILDDDVDGKVFELPKRGKWIWQDAPLFGNPYGSYKCKSCGCSMPHKTNYCPNCGAKMNDSNASNALNALDNAQDGPIITPCRGCSDYDGYGGCKSKGGCARAKTEVQDGQK